MPSRFAVSRAALVPTFFLGLIISSGYVLTADITSAQEAQEEAPRETQAVTDDYRKTLSTLLELMGANVAGEQIAYAVAQETLGAIASTGTPITEEIQQIVVDAALKEYVPKFGDFEYLTNLYGPLYAEHLTQQELDELLAFYQSPLGEKVLVAIPAVAQAGAMNLQQAGIESLPAFQAEIDAKLRSAGVVISPTSPAGE